MRVGDEHVRSRGRGVLGAVPDLPEVTLEPDQVDVLVAELARAVCVVAREAVDRDVELERLEWVTLGDHVLDRVANVLRARVERDRHR